MMKDPGSTQESDSSSPAHQIYSLVVNNNFLDACVVAAKLMKARLDSPTLSGCLEFFEISEILQTVSLIKVPADTKNPILFYCAFAGIFKALHFGFSDILKQL